MKILIYLFAVMVSVSGCVTVGSTNRSYEKINYSDGINNDEAGLIAKHDLIQSDLKKAYYLINPDVSPTYGNWVVTFAQKDIMNPTPQEYRIYINRDTGAIYRRCVCTPYDPFGCKCEGPDEVR